MHGRSETESFGAVARFAALPTKEFMSLEESIEICRAIGSRIARLSPPAQVVIGLANGGTLPAMVAAEAAGIECGIVRVRRRSSRLKQRLGFFKRLLQLAPGLLKFKPFRALTRRFSRTFNQVETAAHDEDTGIQVAGRHVVIVDDCVDSGSSAAHVRDRLHARGAASVRVAVISWLKKHDSGTMHGVEPDIYLHRTLHYYPWALNSPDYGRFEAWLAEHGRQLWR